jgi:hypothetical protein
LEVCAGKEGGWGAVSAPAVGKGPTTPGADCAALKTDGAHTGNGLYWIGDADKAVITFCDMSGDGTVRVLDRNLHLRMSLVLTPARLKLLHACDQWHSLRVFILLTGSRCKLRPNTEGEAVGDGSAKDFAANSCFEISRNYNILTTAWEM